MKQTEICELCKRNKVNVRIYASYAIQCYVQVRFTLSPSDIVIYEQIKQLNMVLHENLCTSPFALIIIHHQHSQQSCSSI